MQQFYNQGANNCGHIEKLLKNNNCGGIQINGSGRGVRLETGYLFEKAKNHVENKDHISKQGC